MAGVSRIQLSFTDGVGTTELCIPFNRFTPDGCPRPVPIQYSDLSHSIKGVPIERGVQHTPRLQWTLKAYLTREEEEKVQELFRASDDARRGYNFDGILLSDRMWRITENVQSRLVVSGEIVETISNNRVRYYPLCSVKISDYTANIEGKVFLCDFVCTELYPTL